MSATRDKSQKITFAFTNFYSLYKKGKEAAQNAPDLPSPPPFDPRRHVLKSGEAKHVVTPDLSTPLAVHAHRPAEFIGRRIAKPPVLQASTAIVTLRQNLKSLTDLHSRL